MSQPLYTQKLIASCRYLAYRRIPGRSFQVLELPSMGVFAILSAHSGLFCRLGVCSSTILQTAWGLWITTHRNSLWFDGICLYPNNDSVGRQSEYHNRSHWCKPWEAKRYSQMDRMDYSCPQLDSHHSLFLRPLAWRWLHNALRGVLRQWFGWRNDGEAGHLSYNSGLTFVQYSGVPALAILAGLVFLSIPWIRKRLYETSISRMSRWPSCILPSSSGMQII